MPAPTHVEDLFSAAVDDELSPAQEQGFHDHLARCGSCRAAYRTFADAVGTVRALPTAAMPLPVHLPSGAPTAERATASGWLRRLLPRTLPMGAATAVGALAAAAIVVIGVTRGSSPASGRTTPSLSAGAGGQASAAAPASCPGAASAGAAPALAYRTSATDRSRPGQQLVLTAGDATAAPGSAVQVFAALTVPAQVVGAPGAAASAATTTITPCLRITGITGAVLAPAGMAAAPAQIPAGSSLPASAGEETFTIPPGTPPGTVIHVIATVPANYPGPSQAPLTTTLDITVG